MQKVLLFGSAALALCLSFSPATAPAAAKLEIRPATPLATSLATPLASPFATPFATQRVNTPHPPPDYGFGEDWCNG